MKKIVVLSLILLMLLSMGTVNAQSQIDIVIDGVGVSFTDAFPFIDENNRTLVPLRAVGEAMGLTIDWNPVEGAIFTKEYTWENSPMTSDLDEDGEDDAYLGLEKVVFKIGENIAQYEESWYNKGESPSENFPIMGGVGEIQMDTAAIIKDSRTYAPVRYLAETFGYYVGWEQGAVMINYLHDLSKIGLQKFQVACWENSQSWLLKGSEDSGISSVDILTVSVNNEDSEYSMLTEEEKTEIDEIDKTEGLGIGSYLTGFTVFKDLETDSYYDYKINVLVTMNDGTTKLGYYYIKLHFDGQGGYI
jgi:hypothetical protein